MVQFKVAFGSGIENATQREERQRDRERGRKRETERDRDREPQNSKWQVVGSDLDYANCLIFTLV